MFVPIPTDVADTRERLMKAHETLAGAKDRHRAVPAELLQDVTQFIPPAVHARASRLTMQLGARFAPPINVVISNVPGPRMPLFIAGAKMERHYPVSVITDGVGLNITCLSYLDHIDFGIVADHDMVDDAWPLMEAVEDALRELDSIVCGKAPTKRAPSRQKEVAPAT
jgi:hypothetical protein